jgi:DEAD/DEAH box helicase domain-containing protein
MDHRNIVYFDLETQRTANDVGGWDRKQDMGMSLGVTYSTKTGEYHVYSERNVDALVRELLGADLVIGYNILHFDYQVLMGYTVLDLPSQLMTLDMMVHLERATGHRPKLESLAQATLGIGKSAEGLDAIRWWRQGRLLEIAEYCCFDVKVTRLIHEHACNRGELYYQDRFANRQRVPIQW